MFPLRRSSASPCWRSPAATATKVNNCPVAVVLADAGQMTVFRPGAPQDLSGEAYRVALTGASTAATSTRRPARRVRPDRLNFRATRAPSADGAHYTVPYFVAVTQGDQLIEKRILNVSFDFAPGASTATFSESPDDFDHPWSRTAISPTNIS